MLELLRTRNVLSRAAPLLRGYAALVKRNPGLSAPQLDQVIADADKALKQRQFNPNEEMDHGSETLHP